MLFSQNRIKSERQKCLFYNISAFSISCDLTSKETYETAPLFYQKFYTKESQII